MMRKTRIAYLLGAAGLGVTLTLIGCSPPAETAGSEDFRRVVNVETARIALRPFHASIQVTARLEAFYDVTVAAEEGGVVDDILPDKGARVRRGQVIARLDADVLQAQLEEARAGADLAQDQYERQQRLWEEQQIGTEQAYIQARESARMRRATVKTLEARLAKKTVRSPVDGIFDDYYVEEGEFAAPGAPIARVISSDRMKVVGGVPERYATEVQVGTAVQIMLDPYPDRVLDGVIDYVASAVDTQSRIIPVEVYLDNPGGLLKTGMLAHLRMVRHSWDAAVVIPQEAVLQGEDGYEVYVAEDRNGEIVAVARPVTIGPSQDDLVVITSGLTAGDRLVILGQLKLGDGDLLNIVNERTIAPDGENDREGESV